MNAPMPRRIRALPRDSGPADGAVSCGSKTLPRTAGMRKYRSFANGWANGSNRPED